MDAKLFWQLPEDVCQLGEFIAAIESKALKSILLEGFMWYTMESNERN